MQIYESYLLIKSYDVLNTELYGQDNDVQGVK